jgi:hypothetical protein
MWESSKHDSFGDYMKENYGIACIPKPKWQQMIIAEAQAADFEAMSFESSLVQRFWVADDMGVREVVAPALPEGKDGLFYTVPTIRFCRGGDLVLVSERLGPDLMFRRLHKFLIEAGALRIGDPIRKRFFGQQGDMPSESQQA